MLTFHTQFKKQDEVFLKFSLEVYKLKYTAEEMVIRCLKSSTGKYTT